MEQSHSHTHEKRTLWVVLLTAVTMVIEIFYGFSTHSMALLADGIHMGSHVLAIGLSWVAYIVKRKLENSTSFNGDSEKILSLAGYTSGILLLLFAIGIAVESVERFISPEPILYEDAIVVAIIGLIVNIVSALLLQHDHDHGDHNIRAAYLHVIADTLTSAGAIVGLLAAKYWSIEYIDTIVAVVSSVVIIKWSVSLLKTSAIDLLTGTASANSQDT